MFFLMSLARLLPLLSILFYKILIKRVKIFLMPLKKQLLLITKKQEYQLQKKLKYVDLLLDEIQKHVNKIVRKYKNFIQLLCIIPGVDRKSDISIISKIGIDML